MNKLIFLVSFLLLLLASCAHRQQGKVEKIQLAPEVFFEVPPSLPHLPPQKLTQILTFTSSMGKHSLQSVLAMGEGKLTIVGLLPFGGEAFRASYSDGVIQTKALPMLPAKFDLKYALVDILLIYLSADDLGPLLSPGTQVKDSPLQREILYQDKAFINISYKSQDRYAADITYQHLLHNYRIDIKTVPQESP